jgi:LETM1 and EF-hand domain-containing protein 1
MLPSTFKEESKEQENLKKRLKAKLEMAKFLQDTLEETALKSSDNNSNEATLNQKFAEFMKKVRTKGEQPTSEEIMKFSSLFENELTLDNLNRNLLIALCQILDISTYGNIPPNHILRFQLRMKIRSLEADDQVPSFLFQSSFKLGAY